LSETVFTPNCAGCHSANERQGSIQLLGDKPEDFMNVLRSLLGYDLRGRTRNYADNNADLVVTRGDAAPETSSLMAALIPTSAIRDSKNIHSQVPYGGITEEQIQSVRDWINGLKKEP
jgi:hypothetical protein